jgi:uncharacterized protein YjiS (DUF1127 family)
MSKYIKPDTFDQLHPTPSVWRRVLRGLAALRTRVRAIVERRRERAALRAFDDRMLRDIGVARWEVEHVLRDGKRPEQRD